jgi:secondary thiamine-phosphate synthase enzyme
MVVTEKMSLESKWDCDIIDITPEVQRRLAETDIKGGTVTLFISGSTAGITTIEFEPGLISDFKKMWERNIPRDIPYEHDRAWGDGNGHSHVRASLLGASLVIPFSDRRLTLGTWQQIVVVDFDNRARSRQIVVQIMGE